MRWNRGVAIVAVLAAVLVTEATSAATDSRRGAAVTTPTSYVDGRCTDDSCGSATTIGPDGSLYLMDWAEGRIRRVAEASGAVVPGVNVGVAPTPSTDAEPPTCPSPGWAPSG